MASVRVILALLVAVVVLPLAAQAEFRLECQMIPTYECAFAVSHGGHRCVLEKLRGSDELVCLRSDIVVGEDAPIEYIETETCVKDCGVERMTVGFSTEELNSNSFTTKLCSAACRENCANIVDLYSNIIAGEGFTLAEYCGEQRRSMLMRSRLLVAEAPM